MQGENRRLEQEEPGIGHLISRLALDAREMAHAEVALVKTRAMVSVSRYKAAAAFFATAAVLGLAALIALLVGLILTLATLIGPGLATLTVIGVTLLLAGVLALIGKNRLSAKVTG